MLPPPPPEEPSCLGLAFIEPPEIIQFSCQLARAAVWEGAPLGEEGPCFICFGAWCLSWASAEQVQADQLGEMRTPSFLPFPPLPSPQPSHTKATSHFLPLIQKLPSPPFSILQRTAPQRRRQGKVEGQCFCAFQRGWRDGMGCPREGGDYQL